MGSRHQVVLIGKATCRQAYPLRSAHLSVSMQQRRQHYMRQSFNNSHYCYCASDINRRTYSETVSMLQDASANKPADALTVPVTFVEPDGTEKEVPATIGSHLLDVAHANNVELEGACGGELACSTCHLIFEQHVYDTLPRKLDDEDDMLDLALALTPTSRLGCQIRVTKELAGIKVQIPDDGF